MARSLICLAAGARMAVFAVSALVTMQSSAWADDPTRPPDAAAVGVDQEGYSGPVLHSVFLPAHGGGKTRPAALINGQRIEVGQRLGEWRLVSVNESSATLVGPEGRQVLHLTPGVDKTRPASAISRRSSGRPAPVSALPSTGNR